MTAISGSGVPVLVRQAIMSDFNAIVQLVHELHLQHYRIDPHIFVEPDLKSARDYCHKYINENQHFLLVAEHNKVIVGLLAVCIHHSAENFMLRADPTGYISLLIVHHNYRRIGIGKRLMQATEKWLLAHDVDEIRLEVLEMNAPARQFYNSQGFINQSRQLSKFLVA